MVLATFHKQHAASFVWPPMAWQVPGLSHNENSVRGSCGPDGYPGLNTAAAHLPRPVHLRQEGYEAEFDRHTLFYDVFHESGGAVKWIGPPLLNLRPWLAAAEAALHIEELAQCSRVTRPGVIQPGAVIIGEGFFISRHSREDPLGVVCRPPRSLHTPEG